MNRIMILLVIVVSYLLIIFILPTIFISRRQGISNLIGSQILPLTANRSLHFEFKADQPNLDKIILTLKNPGLVNRSNIQITINSPNSLRELSFSGYNIGDPSNLEVSFPPFSDPAKTTYQVTITTDNFNDQQLFVYTDQNSFPVFQSFYHQGNFLSHLKLNFWNQINAIPLRSLHHNIFYYSSLLFLIILFLWL